MADEARVSKFGNFRRNLIKFFREVKGELKKVIWPTRSQLVNYTLTVLVLCLLVGAVIWLTDFGVGLIVKLFLARQ